MKKYLVLFAVIFPLALYANTIDSDSKFKRNIKGYPIEAVVEQWGQPNYSRDKRGDKTLYVWKSCYETGIINSYCQYGHCQSWRETKCCYQRITVDDRNIMQDYQDSGDNGARCFSSLDYGRIQQYQKRYDTMYGKLGFMAVAPRSKEVEQIVFSTNVDEAVVKRENTEDCKGRCIKTVDFKNMCVAVARPNTSTKNINEYFIAKDKNSETAVQKAAQQCNKKFAKQGGCCILTWDAIDGTSSSTVCAMP